MRERDREDRVDDDDDRDRGHDRARGSGAEAFRVGLDAQPEIAGDERDQDAEDHALADAQPEVRNGHRRRQRLDEHPVADTELPLGGDHRADERDRAGPQHQERYGDRERNHLRQNEAHRERDAHDGERIDLLGYPHHPELRGHRRPGAAGDEDRREHRTQLAHDADADDVDHEDVGAVVAELVAGKVREHDADEESDERGDAERLGASPVDRRRDLAPGPAEGRSQQRAEIQDDLSEEAHQLERALRASAARPSPSARTGSRSEKR